jgi:hypothetical protein
MHYSTHVSAGDDVHCVEVRVASRWRELSSDSERDVFYGAVGKPTGVKGGRKPGCDCYIAQSSFRVGFL